VLGKIDKRVAAEAQVKRKAKNVVRRRLKEEARPRELQQMQKPRELWSKEKPGKESCGRRGSQGKNKEEERRRLDEQAEVNRIVAVVAEAETVRVV
jgi:hypothetical protein